MSAFIDTATFAKTPAWHRQGIVTEEATTSKDALRNSGLDWTVSKRPVFFEHDTPVMDADGMSMETEYHAANGHYAIVRDDTLATLGVMESQYTILQNSDAFTFMDKLADRSEIRYEAAGSLKNGRVIWLLAQLPNAQEVIPGDLNVPYVLLASSHDGTLPVRIQPTTIRVVCWNTLFAAINGQATTYAAKIKHTSSMESRMEQAITTIRKAQESYSQYIITAKDMTRKNVNADTLATYLGAVLGIKDTKANDVPTRTRTTLDAIVRNFVEDATNRLEGMERSAWAAFNAVTQWVDHQRGSRNTATKSNDNSEENRFHAATFGVGADLKTQAWNKAQEILMA